MKYIEAIDHLKWQAEHNTFYAEHGFERVPMTAKQIEKALANGDLIACQYLVDNRYGIHWQTVYKVNK